MTPDQNPINARPLQRPRPPAALEAVAMLFRERLIWPLQDWTFYLDGRGRALTAGAVVIVAAVIGIGAVLAATGESGDRQGTEVAASVPQPTTEPSQAPSATPEPTLHGAAPVFKPAGRESDSEVSGAKAIESPPAQSSAQNTGSAATDTISSSSSSQPATPSASSSAVNGPPAGPAAIAEARRFARAFVAYEIGGDDAIIRKGFEATASRELTRSLLRRPPRQPAGVEVPRAKVLNVVAGPSHAGIYAVSVSLLRVGVTSELRLEMEKIKPDGWQVTNVLG